MAGLLSFLGRVHAQAWRPGGRYLRLYVRCGYNRSVMSATKTARVNLRVAPADDALLRQAADLMGETLSEFLIESGRERAERLVADRTRFVLDDAAWTAFNDALDRPAEVKPELRELFARSRPE